MVAFLLNLLALLPSFWYLWGSVPQLSWFPTTFKMSLPIVALVQRLALPSSQLAFLPELQLLWVAQRAYLQVLVCL